MDQLVKQACSQWSFVTTLLPRWRSVSAKICNSSPTTVSSARATRTATAPRMHWRCRRSVRQKLAGPSVC